MTKKVLAVRAAGAVLWRATEPEKVEVALVHRPRYDDWTLPKGKVEPFEHDLPLPTERSSKRLASRLSLVQNSEKLSTTPKVSIRKFVSGRLEPMSTHSE